MAPLQAEDFEPHIGKPFRFGDTGHVLSLDRVERHPGAPPEPAARRPFSLVFRGPKPGPVLTDGLYTCVVDNGPTFELYVAPIHTPDPARQEYQSAFN